MTSPSNTSSTPKMQAIEYDRYGPADVLSLREVARPSPRTGQVLLQVGAAGVNPAEWHIMTGTPFVVRLMGTGLRQPKNPRLGLDVAGVVAEVGHGVTKFSAGDRVYGAAKGAYAEYVIAESERLNPLPDSMTMEQGGGVAIGAITALQGLRDKIKLEPGQHVLINGASGGVGTFAVQIAKLMGAEVTGVCSGRNVELVESLGADHVIDYTTTNFTEGDATYDAIFDNVGSHPFRHYRQVLRPKGVVLMVGGKKDSALGPIASLAGTMVQALFVRERAAMFVANENGADLAVLHEWFEAGELRTVIDRTYPLVEAADALRYLETQRARGKVVLIP